MLGYISMWVCSNNPIFGLLARVAGVPNSISGPAIYFYCIYVPRSTFFPSTTFNKPIICITLSQINVSNFDFLLNSISHLTNQIKDKHYKIFWGPFDYIYPKWVKLMVQVDNISFTYVLFNFFLFTFQFWQIIYF